MAGSDRLGIVVTGRQTHGAMPEMGVDAISASAQIIIGLYVPTAEEQLSWDLSPLVNDEPSPDGVNNIGDLLILQQILLGIRN